MDLTTLQKAKQHFLDIGIYTKIENDTLYVCANDTYLELSSYEILFRAKLYDNEAQKIVDRLEMQ